MDFWLTTIKMAALIAVVGIGFNLVYGVLRFLNLAHAELVVLGPLLVERLSRVVPFPVAFALSLCVAAAAGVAASRLLFRPLRLQPRGAMLATSLALALVLQVVYSETTRQASVSLRPHPVAIGPLELSWNGLGFCLLAVLAITVFLELWLRRTRFGLAVLVTAENPTIAEAWGVPVGLVYDIIFGLSFAFAAFGGVLVALHYSISFGFSFKLLVWSFSAILLGGLGSVVGGVVASFPVAALWTFLGQRQLEPYVDPILLLICAILFILLPSGILGRKVRMV